MNSKSKHRFLKVLFSFAMIIGFMFSNSGVTSALAESKTVTTTTISTTSASMYQGGTAPTFTSVVKAGDDEVSDATVTIKYYTEEACTNEVSDITTVYAGRTIYAKGVYAGNDTYESSESNVVAVSVVKDTR